MASLLVVLILTPFGIANGTSDYYEFDIPWDDTGGSPVNMASRILDAPAGKHGRVLAEGGRIVFEDGTSIRFWGMAVAVSSAFPPANQTEVKQVVGKLAKYGFNLVRLNGIDSPRLGLYRHWRETGKLQPEFMQRLDYFISELRKAGIYYALSINDASLKFSDIEGIHTNGHPVRHKQYKLVQLFDSRTFDPVINWHKAFYAHENPYTGKTLAEDAANVYVTAVGEDSIFNGYFRKNAEHIGEENYQLLQVRFNDYLKGRYGTTDRLRVAWRQAGKQGLAGKEILEDGTVMLPRPDDLERYSQARQRDVVRFLYRIELDYALLVKGALREVGYEGLFSLSNDWYGYGSLYVNEKVSDFVDMHGYFDHPIRKGRNGQDYREMTRNISYLQSPLRGKKAMAREFRGNLYNFLAGSLQNKPMLISEWNHAGWSDYTYEGPLLLATYGAFQGYSLLNIHTLYSYELGFKAEYSSRSLAAGGNPVLMSLSPTLALAFIKGYIEEPKQFELVTVAGDENELMDVIAQAGLGFFPERDDVPINSGFTRKLRIGLVDNKSESGKRKDSLSGNIWKAQTGQVTWKFGNPGEVLLTVDTPKFQLAAGRLENRKTRLGNLEVSLKDHGAVTAISLDEKPLSESRRILLTSVSSFKNTASRSKDVAKWNMWKNLRLTVDPGHAPVLMKRVSGDVTFTSKNMGSPTIAGVMLDGSLKDVNSVRRNMGDSQQISFPLGTVDTPWYLVSFAQAPGT
ncbi:MAG: hypothetical protein ABFS45_23750 [Pseudomonadota bacterium]